MKSTCIIGSIVWCMAIIMLIIGSVWLDDNLKWKKDSEQSMCTVESSTSSSCSYSCNCHTLYNGTKHCDTCYGTQYEYYTTSLLCGNTTLLKQKSDDSNGGCPQTPKPIGYQNKCWVECDQDMFSFSSPNSLIAGGIILIVIGGCCCCGGSGFVCFKTCGDK